MDRVPTMSFCEPDGTPARAPKLSVTTRFDLSGKHAIITGGSQGLGRAIAKGFLEHGARKVALLDIDKEQGEFAVRDLAELFPDRQQGIIFRQLDVTDADAVRASIGEVARVFDGVDVLACFAGTVNSVRITDYTPEQFRHILDVNTTGTFLVAQEVARQMITKGTGGSIILTASMAGHIVNYPQTHVAYGTSKSAVHHMTRCMAAELAVHGIRVNSVSPGYMDTRLNSSADLQDVRPIWWARTPMGRIGAAEELVGPLVLLASEAGSFMTGADLRVDG
ncbi:hypothetical protein BJX66DRAFT_328686 [Aspergillus keveii]|uniref:Uncharacterized protein n=1 Tax=Aspergillus keveii TaxID=714993 RepID=A0ABR4FTD9_9EURO